jgi:hypothetical protein
MKHPTSHSRPVIRLAFTGTAIDTAVWLRRTYARSRDWQADRSDRRIGSRPLEFRQLPLFRILLFISHLTPRGQA